MHLPKSTINSTAVSYKFIAIFPPRHFEAVQYLELVEADVSGVVLIRLAEPPGKSKDPPEAELTLHPHVIPVQPVRLD